MRVFVIPRRVFVGVFTLIIVVALAYLSPTSPASGPTGLKGAQQAQQPPTRTARIFFLLDRSGSMSAVRDDVIGGFNAFVEEQRNVGAGDAGDGDALVMTLVQFDMADPHDVVFRDLPIASVPLLTQKTFSPRGSTPLLDAVGRVVADAEAVVAESGNEGDRVVLVVYTDGQENASREFTRQMIADTIEAKRRAGWAVVFLGANVDAYAESAAVGVAAANAQNYAFDAKGVQTSFKALGGATTAMAHSRHRKADGSFDDDFNAEDVFKGNKLAEADFAQRRGPGSVSQQKVKETAAVAALRTAAGSPASSSSSSSESAPNKVAG